MFKASIQLIFLLVLVPSVGSAQSTTPQSYDLSLGLDNRLEVSVPEGLTVVFRNRAGELIEVTESGRVSLRPGSYFVQTGNQFSICRIWAHGSAPPAAIRELPVVRGQSPSHSSWRRCLQHFLIGTGIGLVVWGAATAS
jgi:hypothetical protein